ncbi:hypothetical protein N9933_00205 [bacterium]|nr:hypothetical protein [bacterium]
MEAVSHDNIEFFEASALFTRTEGFIPAPEVNHGIATATIKVKKYKAPGESQTILSHLCGHGNFDIKAYEDYFAGKLVRHEITQEEIRQPLSQLTTPEITQMKFRIARHTVDLQAIIQFYTKLVGLEVLGSFKAHNNYDGVFLGLKKENWHLEFTVSNEPPNHLPDDDDLLVFYPDSIEEYEKVVSRFFQNQIEPVEPKNPYWKNNGVTFPDPNDFRIVIAKPK